MIPVRTKTIPPLLLLLGVSLALVACDAQRELQDSGPNANLSNQELLQQATANMVALRSYHFEFRGGRPSPRVKMSPNLHISGDMQFDDRGSRVTMRDEGDGAVGAPYLILDVGPGIDILMPKKAWYESWDGGKSWYKPTTDTPGGFLLSMFGWWWLSPGWRRKEPQCHPAATGSPEIPGWQPPDRTDRRGDHPAPGR
jgi:hypothetical protein